MWDKIQIHKIKSDKKGNQERQMLTYAEIVEKGKSKRQQLAERQWQWKS